jgi:hypothetical protein
MYVASYVWCVPFLDGSLLVITNLRAELIRRKPLFAGANSLHQLELILAITGKVSQFILKWTSSVTVPTVAR